MQRVYTRETCDPESSFVCPVLLQPVLIVVCDDKTAQHEKEADPHKPLLEEMRTKKIVYNIAMRPKNHHGKNEAQRCQ